MATFTTCSTAPTARRPTPRCGSPTDLDGLLKRAFDDAQGPGSSLATEAPVVDEFNSIMTGWAPLRGPDGRQFGVVGVDIDAGRYLVRLGNARRAAAWGVAPAVLMVFCLSGLYYRARLRGLRAASVAEASAAAAEQAARVLAEERQRLHNVIDGTDVSTWEATVQTGEIRTDARYAEMMGRTLAELTPMTSERGTSCCIRKIARRPTPRSRSASRIRAACSRSISACCTRPATGSGCARAAPSSSATRTTSRCAWSARTST